MTQLVPDQDVLHHENSGTPFEFLPSIHVENNRQTSENSIPLGNLPSFPGANHITQSSSSGENQFNTVPISNVVVDPIKHAPTVAEEAVSHFTIDFQVSDSRYADYPIRFRVPSGSERHILCPHYNLVHVHKVVCTTF